MPRMNRFLPILLLFLTALTGCSTLPGDPAARQRVYEQRLARLDFPTTRKKVYRAVEPAGAPLRVDRDSINFMRGREAYRVDADFVVELSVIYKAAINAPDLLNPSRSIYSQLRMIMDTTQSIDNIAVSGSANHPADIVERARIVRRPMGRY